MPFIEVADDVLVSSSRKMSTTSTAFVAAGRAVLVDPAWLPDELDAIADELDERGLQVTAGFSTHAHHDHLLWHPRFGDVPRWASAGCARAASDHASELLEHLGPGYPQEVLDRFGAVVAVPGDELPEPFGPDGPDERFEVVAHDGHAPGHAAIWSAGRRVLVCGDMLSDIELPLPFWPDDLPAYLAGLDVLAPYVAKAQVLVPGHGTVSFAPVQRLDADRRYLDDVIAGRVPDDERLANPGMREEYEHLVRMVSG